LFKAASAGFTSRGPVASADMRAAVQRDADTLGIGVDVLAFTVGGMHPPVLVAAAYQAGAPATVHVALGADIIHMHPAADGGAIGKATMADFHRLAAVVATLSRGVVLNLGSAVAMPEVFLKALNLARNLGRRVEGLCTADMDFIRQYRPRINVVERPTAGDKGARGIALTGHHEIMFPLLAAAIREELARPARRRG